MQINSSSQHTKQVGFGMNLDRACGVLEQMVKHKNKRKPPVHIQDSYEQIHRELAHHISTKQAGTPNDHWNAAQVILDRWMGSVSEYMALIKKKKTRKKAGGKAEVFSLKAFGPLIDKIGAVRHEVFRTIGRYHVDLYGLSNHDFAAHAAEKLLTPGEHAKMFPKGIPTDEKGAKTAVDVLTVRAIELLGHPEKGSDARNIYEQWQNRHYVYR